MKYAVINFSGNVGKSTISRHLIAARIKGSRIIAVESINSNDSQDEAIKGKQFGELTQTLALLDDAVVDIGSSNVEVFMQLMGQYRGSHEEFDYFVVPTIPKHKQLTDTINTIEALSEIGVPARKIRVVFNMVDVDESPEILFSSLFKYHAGAGNSKFILLPNAVIHLNEIYGQLKPENNIKDIVDDPADYKEKIKAAKDKAEKTHFAKMLGIKRLAAGVTEELDGVFETLFN